MARLLLSQWKRHIAMVGPITVSKSEKRPAEGSVRFHARAWVGRGCPGRERIDTRNRGARSG